MVRRTLPMGAADTVDLGHLAESMISFNKVRLALNRSNLHQLIVGGGPDLAIELVENPVIDAVYLDRNYMVRNEGVGTSNLRHKPSRR